MNSNNPDHIITGSAIESYTEHLSTHEDPVLVKLDRETHLKVGMPHMLSGHVQGLLLTNFVQMLKAKRVIEIGTFTGYSGICLAKGLENDGMLYTLEVNDEQEDLIRKYFKKAEVENKIKLIFGQAADIIPTLNETFDLAFIDADKKNNGLYFDMLMDKMRPGGVILIDNVLWKGKVSDSNKNDKDTIHLREFNQKVQNDPRVSNYIIPIRDGLLVATKL